MPTDEPPHRPEPLASPRERLREVARLFLKLGVIGFGGPAAHIAMMRDEVVRRRGWTSDTEFMDLVGATNLIPGPNSTEMAIHLGLRRAGWRGLAVGGACFIVPAVLITLALAVLYVHYGTKAQATWLLYGIKPAIIAIVGFALLNLGRATVRSLVPAAIAGAVLGLYLAGVNEIVLLCGGAAAAIIVTMGPRLWKVASTGLFALPFFGLPSLSLPAGASTFSLSTLFLTFLKIGSVLYGSGYVLLAFLRSDFVERLHWLTDQQLLDAVAVGQVTPGPVLSTATFVGYIIDRVPGALLATVGIFLPSFIFVALLSRVLPHLRRSPWAGAALDGVNAASLGLMGGVLWQLGGDAITDWYTSLLLALALVVVFAIKVNSAWIVVAGGLAGLAYKGIT